MYYVYVLYSKKYRDLYKGFAKDLKNRLEEHNKGLVKSTKDKRPLDLAYYEAYRNRKDAMAREVHLKTGWGRNYLKKILENYLKENNKK